MLHTIRFSKIGRTILLAALMTSLLLTSVSAATASEAKANQGASAIAQYLAAQANSQLTDEDKIKSAIDAYFRLHYEGQKLLRVQDFSALLYDKSQAWVQKENEKQEIEIQVAAIYKLDYIDYKYFLDYKGISINGDTAIAQLSEGHDVVFEAVSPEVSSLRNLEHIFTLRKIAGS